MTHCQIGPNLRCQRCGRLASSQTARRNCRWAPGLGDRVAAGLSAVGITPERVAAALGVEDCACERRKQLLNRIGYGVGIGTPPPADSGLTG
jgi:hypothetical protein